VTPNINIMAFNINIWSKIKFPFNVSDIHKENKTSCIFKETNAIVGRIIGSLEYVGKY
jgi:hypothetical protein